MKCNVCGRHIDNENANFCENCGNSFRENYNNHQEINTDKTKDYNNKNAYNTNTYNTRANTYNDKNYNKSSQSTNQEEPISFGHWMLILSLPILLMFVPIPFLGPIIYIVIMLIWAFGKNTQTSKRNWARANLLVSIIVLIITIIGTIFLFKLLSDGSLPIQGLEGFKGIESFQGFGENNNFY